MFTALPSSLTSLKTIMSKVSNEIKVYFSTEYGDYDFGTYTKVETYFKLLKDSEYSNPYGLLYKYETKDDDNTPVSKRRFITEDINFNVKNFGFCKSSLENPTLSINGETIIINGNTITFTNETTFEEVIQTITEENITNVSCYIEDGKLVIYSAKFSQSQYEYTGLTLDGTALPSLGLSSGTFKTSSVYFIIDGLKYDVNDYEEGVNGYIQYFYVNRG